MPQIDGSIRISTKIETEQAKKELKSLEKSIEQTASEISKVQKEMESFKAPTKEYKTLQHSLATSKAELEGFLREQQRLSAKGIGKDIDKKYLAAAKAVKLLKSELQQAIASGDKDAYLGIEDRLNRAKAVLSELMQKETRPLGDISYYYSLENSIANVKENISNTESAMQKLSDESRAFLIDAEKQTQATARLSELTQKMESDLQRQSELQSRIAAEEQRLANIKANATISDEKILGIVERRKQILAEIADLEAAGVGLGYKEYEDKNRELAQLNQQIKEYGKNVDTISERFKRMMLNAKNAFSAMFKSTKSSTGALKNFTVSLKHGFKTVLKYAVGIRSLYVLFNKIRAGIKEGFTNLMGYSDSFANSIQSVKNSMGTLGNQIAASFAPVVQMVIPWLNSLINVLTNAISYISQFFAVLGGRSTFTKATQLQDKYNESLGGTAKAADKARGALAKFDDLDVLEKQKDAGGGGGGGSGVGEMFEEVPVSKGKEITALLDELASMFLKLKDAIVPTLNALKRLWNEGLSLLGDFTWGTLYDFYHYFLVPVGKWVLGEGLPRFFDITNRLLKSINWNVLLKSLKGFYDVLAKMAKFTFNALLDFYEHFLAPVATWTMNKALPALLKVLTDLGNKIKWDTLNSALKSMFDTLSKFAVGIGNGLILFLNAVEPVLTTALAGIINITAEALRFLADVIGMIPEDVLAAIGGALAGLFTVFITYKAISGIMDTIKTAWVALYVAFDDGIKLLAANPYMAIAGGIGAIVGALMALEEKTAERSQIAEYSQTIDSLCEAIDRRSEAVKRQSESVRSYVDDAGAAEMLLAENLAGKYYELAEKENLTNAQKEEMKSLSERLVELMPELANNIDKETGLISAQKDEVYGLIEAKREQYRLEAAKESIVEAYRNQLEAEQNLKEATDLTKQAQEAYNEEVRKYNEAMEDYNKHAYDFAEAPTFQYVVEAKDNWKDLAAELETAATAFDLTQDSIKFLENVMESGGKDCTDGFINGYDSEQMVQTVRDSAQSCIDAFKETNDSHSPSKVYEGLAGDDIDGYVLGVEKNKPAAIEAIQQLATDMKEAFVSVFNAEIFSGIFTGIYEQITGFKEMWTETFTLWQEENTELYFGYDIWYEQWMNMLMAYNDVNTEFMSEWQSNITSWWNTMVMPYFTVLQWKTFGENMRNGIMQGFKAIVNNIAGVLSQVIQLFNSAYKQLQDSMNSLIDDYNSKASIMGTSHLSHVNYSAMKSINVPALASGAVIRGGNPFLAILGDQPHGQTNIETPANLIKDMVAQGIAEAGIGSRESIPVNINIVYDGETTARVMIPDILSELSRQGYNVEVLGVT